MNLRALRTLLEIERARSFAAAAERLGLTLSAVSLQMKTLEQELQSALFDRANRPPTLTPAGRRVARHARAMLAEADAIRAVAAEDRALTGDFRLGFVGTASVRLMPGFLAAARDRHPRARWSVAIDMSSSLVRRLRSGDLDAAVVTRTEDLEPDIAFAPLRRETFALAAPPGMALDPTAGPDVEGVAPLIQFTTSSGIGLLVAEHLRRKGAQPPEAVTLDSVEAVMGCVNAGVGFAILPEPDIRRYAAPNVAIHPLPAPGLSRELGFAARAGSALDGRLDLLCALIEPGPPTP